MEKKITRRIIGVLVVFGLVIITLPLLVNTNISQSPLQTAEIQPPPFPNKENLPQLPADQMLAKKSEPAPRAEDLLQKAINPGNHNPEAFPAIANIKLNPEAQRINAPLAANSSELNIEVKGDVLPQKLALKNSDIGSENANVVVIGQNGEGKLAVENELLQVNNDLIDLSKLKKTAWVIQMGSFRNKQNADRLTNSLREKGFKAFTFATPSNGQTRVYVGPEFNSNDALALAGKIADDMKVKGVVLTYKPMVL